MFFLKICYALKAQKHTVLTLQQNVLSKNKEPKTCDDCWVLTLQQNVLSKNRLQNQSLFAAVLTLQQNVLSKNRKK